MLIDRGEKLPRRIRILPTGGDRRRGGGKDDRKRPEDKGDNAHEHRSLSEIEGPKAGNDQERFYAGVRSEEWKRIVNVRFSTATTAG
jgi:hypothetical protein